jgi:polyisoprenoid-binding protein YceI
MKCILLAFSLFTLWMTAPARTLTSNKNESAVTYRLVHPLHKIEATSKEVSYNVEADETARTVQSVNAEVDVTTFDSGNSNRDSHAMEVIDAIDYPTVEFHSSAIEQKGDSIHVTGALTFHGVTSTVTIPGALEWSEKKLVFHGYFFVSLEAYEIERPSLLMIPVEDALHFTIAAAFSW